MKLRAPKNAYERQIIAMAEGKVPKGWKSFGMIEGSGALLVQNDATKTFARFDASRHVLKSVDQRAAAAVTT